MSIWVFRVPTGEGGDPKGRECRIGELNEAEMAVGAGKKCAISYDGCCDFVLKELFDEGLLRQGWGIPTLDLRLPETVWVAKYIIAADNYWNASIGCDSARGRRNILVHMLDFEIGDVVFLPNVGHKIISDAYFTVATVAGKYFFEDRSQEPLYKDFAHAIKVENIKTFNYPTGDINDGIFGAPFMHAVDPVKPHYANDVYDRMKNFLSAHYF